MWFKRGGLGMFFEWRFEGSRRLDSWVECWGRVFMRKGGEVGMGWEWVRIRWVVWGYGVVVLRGEGYDEVG